MKVGALIVIEVHARDVITRLVETKVSAKTDFDWVAQMRYYWELRDYKNPSGCQDTAEIGPDLWVCLVAASQYYGYEYLGCDTACALCFQLPSQLNTAPSPCVSAVTPSGWSSPRSPTGAT